MTEIVVELVDAFVDGGAGGNPAGVVVERGDVLSDRQKQSLAAKLGLSETAFVLPSQSADYKLEFYTPTLPIPHCGHATVASFARLAQLGRLTEGEVVNETVDGPRRIRIEGSRAFLEQVPARFEVLPGDAVRRIAESLRFADFIERTPLLADNGNKAILIGVPGIEDLRRLRPDMDAIAEVTRSFGAVCYYVFARGSVAPGRDATARMFGPAYGIPEEAATGMAAGPLACWLNLGRETLIEQGQFMTPASPSLLIGRPEHRDGKLAAMWIGGEARSRKNGAKTLQVE